MRDSSPRRWRLRVHRRGRRFKRGRVRDTRGLDSPRRAAARPPGEKIPRRARGDGRALYSLSRADALPSRPLGGRPGVRRRSPVLAHEITLEKFREVLGPDVNQGDCFTDFETKVACMFGPNIAGLIPAGDPAWEWFRGRIGGPEYAAYVAAPPTVTFADKFTFHLERRSIALEYAGPAHCDGTSSPISPRTGSSSLAICSSSAASRGWETATWTGGYRHWSTSVH